MKLCKKLVILMAVCLTLTMAIPTPFNCTTMTTQAHSGRTDKYGGHKDNKNVSGLGSYHYHCGGYPAHLHTNGICPYADGYVESSSVSPSASSVNTNIEAATNAAGNTVTPDSSNVNTQSASAVNNTVVSTIKISDTSYDNAAFNASYYASNHADVYETCGDDAKALYNHFITNGIYEGRQSSAQFSILVYKENNQDLKDAFGDDLMKYYSHFIEYGVNENRVSK